MTENRISGQKNLKLNQVRYLFHCYLRDRVSEILQLASVNFNWSVGIVKETVRQISIIETRASDAQVMVGSGLNINV